MEENKQEPKIVGDWNNPNYKYLLTHNEIETIKRALTPFEYALAAVNTKIQQAFAEGGKVIVYETDVEKDEKTGNFNLKQEFLDKHLPKQ